MISLFHRHAEHRHNGIALVFVQIAVIVQHHFGHGGEILVELRHQLLGFELFRYGGKVLDVGKERRGNAPVSAEFKHVRPFQQFVHHCGGEIMLKHVFNVTFAALLLDIAVDKGE